VATHVLTRGWYQQNLGLKRSGELQQDGQLQKGEGRGGGFGLKLESAERMMAELGLEKPIPCVKK